MLTFCTIILLAISRCFHFIARFKKVRQSIKTLCTILWVIDKRCTPFLARIFFKGSLFREISIQLFCFFFKVRQSINRKSLNHWFAKSLYNNLVSNCMVFPFYNNFFFKVRQSINRKSLNHWFANPLYNNLVCNCMMFPFYNKVFKKNKAVDQ